LLTPKKLCGLGQCARGIRRSREPFKNQHAHWRRKTAGKTESKKEKYWGGKVGPSKKKEVSGTATGPKEKNVRERKKM